MVSKKISKMVIHGTTVVHIVRSVDPVPNVNVVYDAAFVHAVHATVLTPVIHCAAVHAYVVLWITVWKRRD